MQAPPDDDVLRGVALHHAYQGSPALLGVSVTARAGEILGVVGPRAAGKTTLLDCLSGRLTPDQGEVWFGGTPVHTLRPAARDRLRRGRFGWVGPTPRLIPELTARENVALPLLLAGAPHRAARKAAQEWLERLDMGDRARKRPADLRHSERQRVAIARALVTMPEVLFADEPTATLHRADRVQVLRTLTNAARTHRITMLLATHDPEVAAFADRTIALVDGAPATALPATAWPAGAAC
jgi:putative ABC transport system ATP-binding protein